MARPLPSLLELAAGRPIGEVDDSAGLVRSAIEHRMEGLLWAATRHDKTILGDTPTTALAHRSLITRTHHRALWDALIALTADLATIDLDVATFKGVTSEARWYDDPGDRPCSDIDLLVAPHHLHRIGELVAALDPAHPLAGDVNRLVATGALQSIELSYRGLSLDVHVDVFKIGIPSRQRDAIWDRTQMCATSYGEFRVLDPETALVQFLLHLNKDRFRWLLGYVDVVRLMERETLDWSMVEAIAAADGLGGPVALSLTCVTSALGLEPAPLPRARGWRALAWRRLWRPSVRLQGDIAVTGFHLRQAFLPALAKGRIVDAARSSARRLAPHPTLVRYRNPAGSGGYVRRLTTGRLERTLARRRAIRRLRRGANQHAERAATSRPGSD